MRRFLFAAATVLALLVAVPSRSHAGWLSEFLHQQFEPDYYGYYTPPVYDHAAYYYGPTHVSPPVDYSTP
jgi:hypothetical protein